MAFRERHCTQRESNPHIRPGETVRCRYDIGAFFHGRIVKDQIAEHRVGLEPTLPLYRCGVLAVKRPVLVIRMGPDGLEPSPTRVRTECAAANTLIPNQSLRSWPGRSRTVVVPL